MNLLSRRFVIAILAMLSVTAALVATLTARPHRFDPCTHPQPLSATSLIPGAKHGQNRELGPESPYLTWTEGTFANPLSEEAPFEYRIVRGFDVLRMTLNPMVPVSAEIDAERHRLESIDFDGAAVPVHIVEDYTRQPFQLIAYYQVYGLTPTSNPMAAHLRNFPGVFRHGSPVVTTVIVNGPTVRTRQAEVEEAALEWLGDSLRFFNRFCAPPSKSEDPMP